MSDRRSGLRTKEAQSHAPIPDAPPGNSGAYLSALGVYGFGAFLHVLLCHTEDKLPLTPARHIALDAVINAIIHRTFGPPFSSMMSRYYADADDIRRILRPMNREELDCSAKFRSQLPSWAQAWEALYAGLLIADDIETLADRLDKMAGSLTGTRSGPFVLAAGASDGVMPAARA